MNERIERLQSEAAQLGVTTGGRRDGLYQTLGAVAAVGGVVVALITYASSLGMENSLDVQSAIILAVAMLGVSVVGSAVFLRYSFARFLRFWLLRQMVEGQDHIDRVVAAVAPPVVDGDRPTAVPAASPAPATAAEPAPTAPAEPAAAETAPAEPAAAE
jgi:hypothetical protein